MRFPDKATIERIRAEYPVGTRMILEAMADEQAPPIGTMGTVRYVDDAGSIGVAWDNGSGLNVVLDAGDRVRKVDPIPEDIVDAIMQVRASGRTNMLAIPTVQRVAYEMELYSLVCWLEDHRAEYWHFIMTGEG